MGSINIMKLIKFFVNENGTYNDHEDGLRIVLKLGNVTFWIDRTGDFRDCLSYDIPVNKWDNEALMQDMRALFNQSIFKELLSSDQ